MIAINNNCPSMPDAAEMPVALGKAPHPVENRMKLFSELFAVDGKEVRRGNVTVIRDGKSELEIFSASDSLRWTDVHWMKEMATPPAKEDPSFIAPEEAVKTSDSFLKKKQLLPESLSFSFHSFQNVAVFDAKSRERFETARAMQLHYGFKVNAMPVFGPGAKCAVTFNGKNEIVQCNYYWRNVANETGVKLIGAKQALDVLANDDAFADIVDKEASLAINGVDLGYYALPPQETQYCLFPVYRFQCALYIGTRYFNNFPQYVLAAKIDMATAKKKGYISSLPGINIVVPKDFWK